jgi:hypothetical protein
MIFPPWTIFIFLASKFSYSYIVTGFAFRRHNQQFRLDVNPELLNLEPLNGSSQTNHKPPSQHRVRLDFSSDKLRSTRHPDARPEPQWAVQRMSDRAGR